jgi:hypothetical protein
MRGPGPGAIVWIRPCNNIHLEGKEGTGEGFSEASKFTIGKRGRQSVGPVERPGSLP